MLEFAGLTDVGRQRADNQDRWGADADQCLFIVADGVANSTNGALAAQIVVEALPTFLDRYFQPADLDDPAAAECVGRALTQLSDELRAYATTDFRVAGATTTVVAVVIFGARALVAHLGDSRAYLYREQRLECLTRDHTVLQQLIDADQKVEGDDEQRARVTLTRHVAMPPPVCPDVAAVPLQAGDRILLCSDGLHGVVDDESLAAIMASHDVPDDACAALIEAANQAGGPDNVTAVVVDVIEPSQEC